jgi:hypothetical protein
LLFGCKYKQNVTNFQTISGIILIKKIKFIPDVVYCIEKVPIFVPVKV